MRRVLTTTTESHPDVPDSVTGEGILAGPLVWQIYVDGSPFLGVPAHREEIGRNRVAETAAQEAKRKAAAILATGRYEYVDVRLVPDRRLSQRRAPDCVLSRVFSVVRPEPERRWVPAGSDRRRAS